MVTQDDYYEVYRSADNFLNILDRSKQKRIKKNSIKKGGFGDLVLELLASYNYIEHKIDDNKETIILTESGKKHLENGAFHDLYEKGFSKKEKPISFKQHLDNLAGLLTIFGILNTIIVFASQIKVDKH
ncbi:hypothetical protein JMG10_03510 [Nostoc ellipsosporum NOK]|nr:hypothetical protein [Nostoc ellipsosporum NOK]